MTEYNTRIFTQQPAWDDVAVLPIDSFHWLSLRDNQKPKAFAQFCGVLSKGLYARLWCFENHTNASYIERDDPVYKDSCLELFFQPVVGRREYINIETNSKGVFLSQFGKGRMRRVFLKQLTSLAPEITVLKIETQVGRSNAWGVEIFVPDALIAELYHIDYHTGAGLITGNFYKCADAAARPHYAAAFPVGDAVLGFHNPGTFGKIILH